MESSVDYDSVDLTEDEDSRETVDYTPESTYPSCNQFFQDPNITTAPPPLTPFKQFTTFQNIVNRRHPTTVPKLKKINPNLNTCRIHTHQKNSVQAQSESVETVCIDPSNEDCRTSIPPQAISAVTSCDLPQDLSGKLVVIKKNNEYYRIVIPYNVMPIISQTAGPVSINIPGVGPLIIKIDPNAHQIPTSKTAEPLSLNFDEVIETPKPASQPAVKTAITKQKEHLSNPNAVTKSLNVASGAPERITTKKTTKKSSKCSKDSFLSDPRFCSSLRNENAELLGFRKNEIYRTRKCYRILDTEMWKRSCALNKKLKYYNMLKKRAAIRNKVQPVKISEIIGQTVNKVFVQRLNNKSQVTTNSYVPEPFKRYNLQQVRLPPNTLITQMDDYNSDLLLTKKVVILDKATGEEKDVIMNTAIDKTESSVSQKKRSRPNVRTRNRIKREKKKQTSKINLKPCYIKMVRDEYVEQFYRDFIRSRANGRVSQKGSSDNVKAPSPRKAKVLIKHSLTLEAVWKIFMSKMISTELRFQTEMAFIKPILVLNEYNFGIVKYCAEFSKSNIIYSVNRERSFPKAIMNNDQFVSAVELGYVKLVDEELLCLYLKGQLGPRKLWERQDSDDYYSNYPK